jgi:hypothetical protein
VLSNARFLMHKQHLVTVSIRPTLVGRLKQDGELRERNIKCFDPIKGRPPGMTTPLFLILSTFI